MKIRLRVSLSGLCLAYLGCGPIGHAVRTVIVQPLEYCRYRSEAVDCLRDEKLAKEALAVYEGEHSETPFAPDFEKGFIKGYVEFLYAGGTGCAPPLPPRCYWNPPYQSAEGHQAIRDWFAGFQVGSAVARQSGLRELVVVPASTALDPALPPPQLPQSPAAPVPPPSGGQPATTFLPPDEVLPQPRNLPPTSSK